MDALSETLRVVRLTAAIFVDARLTAPWSFEVQAADAATRMLAPGAEKLVIFHLLAEGECWVEVEGQPPLHMHAGDVVLLPQGHAHRMAAERGGAPAPMQGLGAVLAGQPRQIAYGGGGAPARMPCGFMACDARLGRLLMAGLPPVVQVSLRGSHAGDWLEASVRYALAEVRSPRPGGDGVLAKLAEVLFVEVLRLYMDQAGEGRTGWLTGVGDRIVGAALQAMHKDPAHAWTLEELARLAGASRTVLAERFHALVGSTPMQYLAQWRMLLAANLLRAGKQPLTVIAQGVGYQTDTAFSRAFRREFGVPPAAWRRSCSQAAPATQH